MVFLDVLRDCRYMRRMKNHPETSLVVKSNALINATFDMSLQGNRFLAFAISLLTPEQRPAPGHPLDLEIPVVPFAKTFGVPVNTAYRDIAQLSNQFLQKLITLPPDQTLDGSEVTVGLVSKRKYRENEGRVWVRFDEDIVPHIFDLKERFTSYRLKDVYQFTRANSWRVYELLKEFKGLGQREFDVEEFKFKVGVGGLYPRIGDLKKRVIDPAIAEINATSDILVQYDQRKRGRVVVALLFIIRDNDTTKTPQERIRAAAARLDDGQDRAPELSRLLRSEYHMAPTQARQMANLAATANRKQEITDMLPNIKARFDRLPQDKKKTTLGGYVFKSLSKELLPKQHPLPM